MATFEIPLRSALPTYSFTFELESSVFTFSFAWNTRSERWFFDIKDENGNNLLVGNPVLVNWSVVGRFQSLRLPKGNILFFDTSGNKSDPERFDLGNRVKMLYRESA